VLEPIGVDVTVFVACVPFHQRPTMCGSKVLPTQSDSEVLQLYVSGKQQFEASLQSSSVAYDGVV